MCQTFQQFSTLFIWIFQKLKILFQKVVTFFIFVGPGHTCYYKEDHIQFCKKTFGNILILHTTSNALTSLVWTHGLCNTCTNCTSSAQCPKTYKRYDAIFHMEEARHVFWIDWLEGAAYKHVFGPQENLLQWLRWIWMLLLLHIGDGNRHLSFQKDSGHHLWQLPRLRIVLVNLPPAQSNLIFAPKARRPYLQHWRHENHLLNFQILHH